MRRVWHDIDQARDKLGLRAEPASDPESWSVGGCVGHVVALASDVGAWVGALPLPWASATRGPDGRSAPETVRSAIAALPVLGSLVAPLLGPERPDDA